MMTIKDWILVGALVLWVLSIATVALFGNKHFKNKYLEEFRSNMVDFSKSYSAFYDKQIITKPEKLSGAVNDVANALRAKGFKISDQDLKDIEAQVEQQVAELHTQKKSAESTTPTVEVASEPQDASLEDEVIVGNIDNID